MSFQFQLLTQLDSIHKHVKQEDIDREKIRKWVLRVLKESPELSEKKLDELYDLYHKFFNEVLEVILDLRQEIEDSSGDDQSVTSGSTKVLTITTAAKKLGISRSTLYDKINKGLINTTLDGKIHEDELMRYLAGR